MPNTEKDRGLLGLMAANMFLQAEERPTTAVLLALDILREVDTALGVDGGDTRIGGVDYGDRVHVCRAAIELHFRLEEVCPQLNCRSCAQDVLENAIYATTIEHVLSRALCSISKSAEPVAHPRH